MTHAHPAPPIPHPTNSIGLATPPSNPSSSTLPPANRLNAASTSFVPQQKKVVVKNQEGVELTLGNLKPPASPATNNTAAPLFRQGSPGTPNRRPASIRIETEDQRNQRLAEENEKARLKTEAEEKVKREKEEADRKAKEEEERKKKEEEAEKERIKEEKEKERLRRLEEERLRKEEEEREAQRVREEEERIRKEEEEAKRLVEEQARKAEEERLRQEKEAKERGEMERTERERFEKERLAKEAEKLRLDQEAQRQLEESEAPQDGKADEQEEGEIVEEGLPTPIPDAKERGKESLRIDTKASALRRHPGHLDLTDAKKSTIPAPQSALATARVISDINAVSYPEGVSSPNPALNENAKDGKFR